MSYINFNPNPDRKLVGDCVIRAISKAMNQSWEDTYMGIMLQGFAMHDMPSSNDVWGRYLFEHGFRRYIIPDTCPDCCAYAGAYDASQENEYSGRRGRSMRTGRYVSRDSEKERMIGKLEDMMENAPSEKERRVLQQCVDKLEQQ